VYLCGVKIKINMDITISGKPIVYQSCVTKIERREKNALGKPAECFVLIVEVFFHLNGQIRSFVYEFEKKYNGENPDALLQCLLDSCYDYFCRTHIFEFLKNDVDSQKDNLLQQLMPLVVIYQGANCDIFKRGESFVLFLELEFKTYDIDYPVEYDEHEFWYEPRGSHETPEYIAYELLYSVFDSPYLRSRYYYENMKQELLGCSDYLREEISKYRY